MSDNKRELVLLQHTKPHGIYQKVKLNWGSLDIDIIRDETSEFINIRSKKYQSYIQCLEYGELNVVLEGDILSKKEDFENIKEMLDDVAAFNEMCRTCGKSAKQIIHEAIDMA